MIRIRSIIKWILRLTELFLIGIFCFFIVGFYLIRVSPPEVKNFNCPKRIEISDNHYVIGNNWLKKNKFGIWEMYVEGQPYERGVIYGELAKELCQKQEHIFVSQINDLVPGRFLQEFLRFFIGFFNRNITNNIPLENQQEIYGISKSFTNDYNYIAPKYMRILNYHSSHDIGHALNDYSLVGCSSFSVKDSLSYNNELIAARNFDFYIGDEFAKDKLLLFMKPDKGYPFASYSWAGFTGVVSGLNVKGLSVTINASMSKVPTSSKTPISILTRKILQYASTIDEAIKIAAKSEIFVSESIMVSSSFDNKTIIIEKTPEEMSVYDPGTNLVVCTNHYQSENFLKSEINKYNIANTDSKFRYDKITQSIYKKHTHDLNDVVDILRDQKGINNDTIGMGNPKAVNQLLAHHSIVIQPKQLIFYVSTTDYQLGAFVGYQLSSVFQNKKVDTNFVIAPDPFLYSDNYEKYKCFNEVKNKINKYLMFDEFLNLNDSEIETFINSNSESYVTYQMLAKYYNKKENYLKSISSINTALTKNLPSENIKNELLILLNNE